MIFYWAAILAIRHGCSTCSSTAFDLGGWHHKRRERGAREAGRDDDEPRSPRSGDGNETLARHNRRRCCGAPSRSSMQRFTVRLLFAAHFDARWADPPRGSPSNTGIELSAGRWLWDASLCRGIVRRRLHAGSDSWPGWSRGLPIASGRYIGGDPRLAEPHSQCCAAVGLCHRLLAARSMLARSQVPGRPSASLPIGSSHLCHSRSSYFWSRWFGLCAHRASSGHEPMAGAALSFRFPPDIGNRGGPSYWLASLQRRKRPGAIFASSPSSSPPLSARFALSSFWAVHDFHSRSRSRTQPAPHSSLAFHVLGRLASSYSR